MAIYWRTERNGYSFTRSEQTTRWSSTRHTLHCLTTMGYSWFLRRWTSSGGKHLNTRQPRLSRHGRQRRIIVGSSQVDQRNGRSSIKPNHNGGWIHWNSKVWTETTTTSPSDVHLGHYKALIAPHEYTHISDPYGSRPRRNAINPVVLEELQFEISRLSRKSFIQTNYDVMACYNCIIPSLATLASCRHWVHKYIAITNEQTLEKARYLSEQIWDYCQSVTPIPMNTQFMAQDR